MSAPQGVQVNVKTNAAEVANNIKGGTDEIMKMLPNALKEYVVECVKELLKKSYPAPGNDPTNGGGGTAAAVDQGKDNLAAEINSAFTTWDNTKVGDLIMAKNEAVLWNLNNPIAWRNPRLERAFNTKDIDTLYRAFAGAGWVENEDKTNYQPDISTDMHAKARDPASGAILAAVKNNKQLRISVRDRQAIESYIITKQKSIGTMAGGWIKALSALGSPVADPFGGAGAGGATISNKGLTIKATNELGDYNGMISRHGIIEAVVREKGDDLKEKLDKEIDRILKASAKGKGGKP